MNFSGAANAIAPVVVPGADTVPVRVTFDSGVPDELELDEPPPEHPAKLKAAPITAAQKITLEKNIYDPPLSIEIN